MPLNQQLKIRLSRLSRYDQENILNGLKNGSNTAIPDSYVGYSNYSERKAVIRYWICDIANRKN